MQLLGKGRGVADSPCLSPPRTWSAVLLKLTDFLFPTDAPWRGVAPPDAPARVRMELFLMFHYTLCINIDPD